MVNTKTRRPAAQSKTHKKVTWKDVCPTCVKYDHPDHSPDCDLCRQFGITENILCTLNRMDQEQAAGDFECDAYQPKYSQQ